jgi:hypothetical protein
MLKIGATTLTYLVVQKLLYMKLGGEYMQYTEVSQKSIDTGGNMLTMWCNAAFAQSFVVGQSVMLKCF